MIHPQFIHLGMVEAGPGHDESVDMYCIYTCIYIYINIASYWLHTSYIDSMVFNFNIGDVVSSFLTGVACVDTDFSMYSCMHICCT